MALIDETGRLVLGTLDETGRRVTTPSRLTETGRRIFGLVPIAYTAAPTLSFLVAPVQAASVMSMLQPSSVSFIMAPASPMSNLLAGQSFPASSAILTPGSSSLLAGVSPPLVSFIVLPSASSFLAGSSPSGLSVIVAPSVANRLAALGVGSLFVIISVSEIDQSQHAGRPFVDNPSLSFLLNVASPTLAPLGAVEVDSLSVKLVPAAANLMVASGAASLIVKITVSESDAKAALYTELLRASWAEVGNVLLNPELLATVWKELANALDRALNFPKQRRIQTVQSRTTVQ